MHVSYKVSTSNENRSSIKEHPQFFTSFLSHPIPPLKHIFANLFVEGHLLLHWKLEILSSNCVNTLVEMSYIVFLSKNRQYLKFTLQESRFRGAYQHFPPNSTTLSYFR